MNHFIDRKSAGQQFRIAVKLPSIKADFALALSSGRKVDNSVKDLRQAFIDYISQVEAIPDRLKDPAKESFICLFKLKKIYSFPIKRMFSSFTCLKLSGTPVSFISDALGHTNSKTSEHYLKSIPTENLKTMSSQLLSFA